MKLQVIKNRVLFWIRTLLLYSGYLFLVLCVLSFFIIQIPYVQTRLVRTALEKVSQQTGFQASIGHLEFYWFDRLRISSLQIIDPAGNPMIDIGDLRLNFSFRGLFQDGGYAMDALMLDNVSVYLANIPSTDTTRDLNINLFIQRLSTGADTVRKDSPFITCSEIFVKNSFFAYVNDRDSIKNAFDYNHFRIALIDAEIQQFRIHEDTVSFRVGALQAKEQRTGFTIHRLETFFRYSGHGLEFPDIRLHAGNSFIADTVIFRYDSERALDDFLNAVQLDVSLRNAVIDPADLALFAPGADQFPLPITLSGRLSGTVSDFRFADMEIRMGNTYLKGYLSMEGLPDWDETFTVLELHKSTLDFRDLGFLFNKETAASVKNLGAFHLNGQFLGYPNDFVAQGDFQGRIGKIRSDINLKINESNPGLSAYSGSLALTDFNLGAFFQDTILFQRVNMKGKIKGKGITLETADFLLDGQVSSIGIMGYNYTSIVTNARFSNQLFSGFLSMNDPNASFTLNGIIDLRNNINHLELEGKIDSIKLEQLNLSTKPIHLRSEAELDIYGFTLDSLEGEVHLKNLQITYIDESLSLEKVILNLTHENNIRGFALNTSLVDAELHGNFKFSDLINDVVAFFEEFSLSLQNNAQAIEAYYRKKTDKPRVYEAAFRLYLKNLNPFFNLLDIPLNINRNIRISGSYTHGPATRFQVNTYADSVKFGTYSFIKNIIEINASKSYAGTDALAMVYLHSDTQSWSDFLTTSALSGEAIWDGNQIMLETSISHPPDNSLRIRTHVDFKDSTYIFFEPSSMTLFNNLWQFNPNNYIAISGKEWHIHNLTLQAPQQFISLNGHISSDSLRSLKLTASRIELKDLSSILGIHVAGHISGNIVLSNPYSNRSVQNAITISNFMIDNFLVGDIISNNQWNAESKVFDLAFFIDRLGSRIIDFKGHYNPAEQKSPLHGNARLSNANVKMFEPFLQDLFSNLDGTATGSCSISGTLDEPELNGSIGIENGSLMVNYLKTQYRFNGTIDVTPSSIYFRDFALKDVLNNTARLQGEIRHQGFSQMALDIRTSFTDFQVLNTTARDNELFYGQAYATGQATFQGPVNNLNMVINATTRKNTRFFIPVQGVSVSEHKDFITFVNLADSTSRENQTDDISKNVTLTGFNMELNLEVTPDAYSEIIFDIKAGDIIRGRGNGKLKLQINTEGEFSMFGPLEFSEAWYNFTLQNIINKEFQIKPGSRMTWYGDPYQAVLDITASYQQLVSLAPILNDPALANAPQLKRKFPVEVILKLEGPMLTPQIGFDIQARDLPKSVAVEGRPPVALDLEFYSYKSQMDEQELKKQVFSLIVLRRFTPRESFSMSGSVANSVSELLSNQLSYWMSQVDENLDIDVNLGTLDQEAFNTFQLRLSYTLLNGRMRITGDGTFNNQATTASTNVNQPGAFTSLAGDWTIDYLLTPDGRFKVKMYSRANINQNAALNSINTLTTGVSLTYTENFNTVKELLRVAHEKSRQQNPPEPPDSSARKEDEE